MNPVSAMYAAAVSARNELYDRGRMTVRRLQGPVVSIGNLSVGGSGKTPFLIGLGELLQERGIAFDVLSRGYRRQTRGTLLVRPEGSAAEFGDEPLLIARKLEVPVVVGEDRYQAGVLAEKSFGPRLHLLDDGFQHRRLAREFDIVLVNASDNHDSLLPVGRLREPLSSLSRADAVVLTNGASIDGFPLHDQQPWGVRRDVIPPDVKVPCIAFCGIARPENFFADLRAAGVSIVATRCFRDHHSYSDADIGELLRLRRHNGGAPFLLTEKDAMNLGAKLQQLQPAYIVPVRLILENAETAVSTMLARVAERKHRIA